MLRLKIPLIISVLFFTSIAFAQISACNTDVTGKNVKWNSSWAEDQKDNGQIYKVTRVTELKKDEVVIFELVGSDTCYIRSRDLLIQNMDKMAEFCKNIESTSTNIIEKEDTSEETLKEDQYRLLSLPFIKYAKSGWQRADAPANKTLSSCELLGKKFSCTIEDKKLYLDRLKELESEVKMMHELGY